LFRDEFAYCAPFFGELIAAVDAKIQKSHVKPRWIDDLRHLAKFFSLSIESSNKGLEGTGDPPTARQSPQP
jgi:hypothetical protein